MAGVCAQESRVSISRFPQKGRGLSQGRQALGVSGRSAEAAVAEPGQVPCLQERAAEMWPLGCTVASKSMSQRGLVAYRQAEFWSKMTGR